MSAVVTVVSIQLIASSSTSWSY